MSDTPIKQVRRTVVSATNVPGYRGSPSTLMTLSCGHRAWFPGRYPWEVKRKTTICNECTKAANPQHFGSVDKTT